MTFFLFTKKAEAYRIIALSKVILSELKITKNTTVNILIPPCAPLSDLIEKVLPIKPFLKGVFPVIIKIININTIL